MTKLELYKTAFSPLYDEYVEINDITYTVDNQPLIQARLAYSDDSIYFREDELIKYSL